MYKTKVSFRSVNLSDVLEFIQCHIPMLFSLQLRKHDIMDKLTKEFEQAQSMTEFFKILRKNISWFNFELVTELVNVFMKNNRNLKQKWSTYREKLRDYFRNDSSQAVQIGEAVEFGLSNFPDTKVMVAKVEKDDYTVNDLYFFRQAIADALDVPDYKFYFCEVSSGCMELKYSIPEHLCSILFPLTDQQCQSLAKIGINKITCGGYKHEMKKVCAILMTVSSFV